jgi:transcriptional regulator with XRE-family HTH domain
MKKNQKQMISELVKQGRLSKGYTQKELSGLSNISVRSIQRIENGEIVPRSYTLKTLSGILGLSFENIQKAGLTEKPGYKINKGQKIILSIGISLFILLLSWAFIAQSPRFPETHFEFFIFSAFVLSVITAILIIVWRTKH